MSKPPSKSLRPASKSIGRGAPQRAAYTVGYGRPPVNSRFKEGNNANPHGRPVGARSQAAVLNEQLNKKITITERDGSKKRITTLQAILMTQVREALKGNQKAAEFLLKYHRQVEEGLSAADQLDADDQHALEILLNEEINKRAKVRK